MDRQETFTELLLRIGRTDKQTRHSYGPLYDEWFAGMRELPLKILEVGVSHFGGGSLLALAAYFPNATIYGVDIDLVPICEECRNHPRIKLIQGDAYAPGMLASLNGTFSITIDDCVHDPDRQVKLATLLRPMVELFHVIEDVRVPEFMQSSKTPNLQALWSIGYTSTMIDVSHPACLDNTLIKLEPRSIPWDKIDGWFSEGDARVYRSLLEKCAFELVVEVGSYQGRSAAFAAPILRKQGCNLICVDPWNANDSDVYKSPEHAVSSRDRFRANMAEHSDVVQDMPVPSLEAAKILKLSGARPGLVFIDGCHLYDQVRADILAWRPLLRAGGILCGHDYRAWPGVTRAVDELIPDAKIEGMMWSYQFE